MHREGSSPMKIKSNMNSRQCFATLLLVASSLYSNQEAPATLLQLTEKSLNQTQDNLKDLLEKLPKKRQELLQRPYKQWDLLRVNYTIAKLRMNKTLLTMQQHVTDLAEAGNLRIKERFTTAEKCADYDQIIALLNEEATLIHQSKQLLEQQSNFYQKVEKKLTKAQSSLRRWSTIDNLSSDTLSSIGICEGARFFKIHPILQSPRYTTYATTIARAALTTKIVGIIGRKYTESTVTRKMSQLAQHKTAA